LQLLNGEQSNLLYAAENAEKVRSCGDFNDVVIIGAAKRMGMEAIGFDRKNEGESRRAKGAHAGRVGGLSVGKAQGAFCVGNMEPLSCAALH